MSHDPNWNPDDDMEPQGFSLFEVVYAFLDFALHVFALVVLMLAALKMLTGDWC